MMIGNLIKCEKCGKELQPSDIGVRIHDEDLFRICLICGHEVKVG
jgi:hypothetical protein